LTVPEVQQTKTVEAVLPVHRRRTTTGTSPHEGGSDGRDRYLDLLRGLALVRVVTYHTFGWVWLTFAFPSLGVMFALAGSLMARSLARPALSVVKSRTRRLLPPFWVFGAIVLTAMLVRGWAPGNAAQAGVWWSRTLLWIFPVTDPPSLVADWSQQISGPLWYIRTYLWFVLLSPLLLRAFRRAPWTAVTAFLALAALFQYGLVPGPGPLLTALTDVATFGACWLLGFAHREGRFEALTARTTCAAAAVLLAGGAWFAYSHPTDEGLDLGEIPLAQALWSVGFVLLLLRFRPRRPLRLGAADGPVHLLNARAVTVYLWHEVALVLTVPLTDLMWKVPAFEMSLPLDAVWFQYLVAWPLIAIAVVLFGWTEDLAARRRPRLWPWRA